MAFIEVEHVSYVYHEGQENEHRALEDISLAIEAGEFIAILGTNGSGKSTLARHLNGLLLPTAGRVCVDGMDTTDVGKIWELRRKVGMVFQNPDNQIIAAIVEDDVAFGPENLGMDPKDIRDNINKALESVDMAHFCRYAPHLLSGGQKQRVAIAGILAMQTKCIVLDEPTAMLDPKGREEVLSVIKKLHEEQGITVILITHFMGEAAEADRIFVMEKGKLIREGMPREIFSKAEYMQSLGLVVPHPAHLAARLRGSGMALPKDVLTKEDLAAAVRTAWEKCHGD